MAPYLGTNGPKFRDMVSGHSGDGLMVRLGDSELFSNLNNPTNQPKGWRPVMASQILHRHMGEKTNKQTPQNTIPNGSEAPSRSILWKGLTQNRAVNPPVQWVGRKGEAHRAPALAFLAHLHCDPVAFRRFNDSNN